MTSASKAKHIQRHVALTVLQYTVHGITLMLTQTLVAVERKKRKVYAIRRQNGSLCTQKQPETAAPLDCSIYYERRGGQLPTKACPPRLSC